MSHDLRSATLVALQPLPALLVAPSRNRIIDVNDSARQLFGAARLTGPLSDLLLSARPDVAVFFDAVSHFGRYVDRSVSLANEEGAPMRLETIGMQLAEDRVLLSFIDLDGQDRRNRVAEQEAQLKGGLMQWRNIYSFFQEVEAQNHLILEAAGEGIYGINADGKATFVNRAAQEMLGWSAEDLIGRDLHAIIHHKHLNGDHFPAHECPIYASFRKDETVRVDDDAFWRKDGKPILVEYVSTPIYDHGFLAGAVVIFRDVTERRENDRKLREAMAEVQELRVKLEQENDYLLTEIRTARSHTGVVGVSPAIKTLNAQIDLAAKNKTNVLVSGPPGSGKSLAVSAIHEASDRANRPLVRINCGQATEELAAELFGYRRGAFPKASRDVTGKLMLAQNGTLHLDEVADLPMDFQAKLSSILQDRKFSRLGDTTEHKLSLTIVATTSRNLLAEVQAGRVRQDLYFALSIILISCEALKERPEDIPYLARHFLERSTRRLRLPPSRLSNSNIEALKSYDWPGNVRELENVIERAAILAQGGKLKFDFAPEGHGNSRDLNHVLSYEELRELERHNLTLALKQSDGKVSGQKGAAKRLGLPATTVYSKLKAFGLDARAVKADARD